MADERPLNKDEAGPGGEPPIPEDPREARMAKLEAEMAAKKEFTSVDLPEMDPELDARIRDVQTRARLAKHAHDVHTMQEERKMKSDGEAARGLGVGLTAAYAIIGMPLVGAGIGWLIDRNVDPKIWTGLCTVAGALLGITFTIITINRTNKD